MLYACYLSNLFNYYYKTIKGKNLAGNQKRLSSRNRVIKTQQRWPVCSHTNRPPMAITADKITAVGLL